MMTKLLQNRVSKPLSIVSLCLCFIWCDSPGATLVGHWEFKNPASLGYDTSGLDNHGTSSNVVAVPGIDQCTNSGAAFYSGSNSVITVPHSSSQSITGVVSIAAWFRYRAPHGAFQPDPILAKGHGDLGTALNYSLSSVSRSATTHRFDFSCYDMHWFSPEIDTNWHHFALVAPHGASTPEFFLDGAAVTATSGYSFPRPVNLVTNSEGVTIGGNGTPPGDYYVPYYSDAVLADVRLYDGTLSSSDVQSLYEGWRPFQLLQSAKNVIAFGGGTAVFAVAATGGTNDPITYQWSRNGVALADGGNISGATGATLTIQPVTSNDFGAYQVSVVHGSCTASSTAELINATDYFTPPSGLVAYWPFDGDTRDRVGTNHGTIGGAPYFTNGLAGCAMYFRGSCAGINVDQVAVPHSPELNVDDHAPFSFSIWVSAATDQNEGHIFGKRLLTCTSGDFNYQLVYHNWMPGVGWGPYGGGVGTSRPLPTGNWTHVAGSFDGNVAQLYFDGVPVATASNTIFGSTNLEALLIGASGLSPNCGNCTRYRGTLDDFAIWRRAISSNEVVSIYGARGKRSLPSLPPNIVSAPTNSPSYECGELVTLTAQVADTEGDALAVHWLVNGVPLITNLLSGDGCSVTSNSVSFASTMIPVGTNEVVARVFDGRSGYAYTTNQIVVVDTVPPVLGLLGANPQVMECHTTYVELGATASDTCAGDLTGAIVINTTALNANAVGTYIVTYNVHDPAGNAALPLSRTVQVVDTIPPVISLAGTNPMTVECHTSFTDPGATATDTCVGTVAVTTNSSVDPNAVGSYTIAYTATDGHGNIATNTRTVVVIDTTPPTVALAGSNVVTVECHNAFLDPGATAQDSCAGSLAVMMNGSVNTNSVGSYALTYSATDSSGNSTTNTRLVQVVDTIAPVITLAGGNTLSVECHRSFVDPGVAATDTCAGSVSVTVTGFVDTNSVGSYTLTYTATDGHGNIATNTRTVNVLDTTPPVVNLAGTNPLTLQCHSPFVDPGATAVDSCAGSVAVTVSGTVNTNSPGTYVLSYSAGDGNGNTNAITRIVNVVDTVSPTIACPAEVVVFSTSPLGTAVSFSVTGTDSCDPAPVIVCNPPSGSVFAIGTNTVDCTATDSSGNSNHCSFTLIVHPPDFGDAPYSVTYHTLFAHNGARHAAMGPAFASVLPTDLADGELDGVPSINADGDDVSSSDDEQGIRFLDPLVAGMQVRVEFHVFGGGLVNAWWDFNADRDWTDPGEQIFTNLPVAAAVMVFPVTIPATAVTGTNTYVRFRISSMPDLAFDGPAPDGEVEDYRADLICPCCCFVESPRPLPDPLLTSWATNRSGNFALVRLHDNEPPTNKWLTSMTNPVYADIQKIEHSADAVYISAPGLASYVMGPWYLDWARTNAYADLPTPILPSDQGWFVRFPRTPVPATSVHSNTPLGIMGLWVNGTAVFNTEDALSWSKSATNDTALGDDVWHRDASFAETVVFDAGNQHQPVDGIYHAHVTPKALRRQLGEKLTIVTNAAGQIVQINEPATPTNHSPLIGWAFDGHPIYGPYGYSNPHDTNSPIRRLVSGYVLRNGSYGTVNLTNTGRTSLPAWAHRVRGTSTPLLPIEFGPAPNRPASEKPNLSFQVGRYVEDYEYLGDLPDTAGKPAWDLDQFNGRCGKTPEFPYGVYAYFTTVDASGVPAFPYTLGPQYCSMVTGGVATNVTEQTTVDFDNRTDVQMFGESFTNPPSGQTQFSLGWRSLENATYVVERSPDLQAWNSLAEIIANSGSSRLNDTNPVGGSGAGFYRVIQKSLVADDTLIPGRDGIGEISPQSAPSGSSITLSITLLDTAMPTVPSGLPIEVTVGGIQGTNLVRTGNIVTATVQLPPSPATLLDVKIRFRRPTPPGGIVVYTLARGFETQ